MEYYIMQRVHMCKGFMNNLAVGVHKHLCLYPPLLKRLTDWIITHLRFSKRKLTQLNFSEKNSTYFVGHINMQLGRACIFSNKF